MAENRTGPVVGIDLGTTNSVVAAVINGVPQVLSDDNNSILPSVVGVDAQDRLIVGHVARNQLAAFPERTIASIKRRMGTMEKLRLGDNEFTPPEVSAIILRRLRDRAVRALGQPVERAVITVPAFFDENQRQATREAGLLAGLHVERIINEPTAATLVYHAGTTQRRHIAVYDFGGGTFDVSIVRLEDGVVEVLSSKGDTRLGGDDLDGALMKFVADDFVDRHGVDLLALATSRFRLLRACEAAKIQLSHEVTAHIREEFIAQKDHEPLHLEVTVTREEYEALIVPFVDRTIACVDEALRDARLMVHQIDDLVLVGGSTRTPMVERRLREEFNREPSRAVDPDLAVALGAAIQGAMIDGVSVGPVLVDVTGHTLGVEVLNGVGPGGMHLGFSPIIHRNSPLPACHEEAYYRVHEEQKRADIHVLQGEHADPQRNRSIGRFSLDLAEGRGEAFARVDVRFNLTLDGTLRVTATQAATGLSNELSIANALSQFQTDERAQAEQRLERMFGEAEGLLDTDERDAMREWRQSDVVVAGEARYPAAHSLIKQAQLLLPRATDEDAEEIRELSQRLRDAIEQDIAEEVATISEELDDVLFYVQQ